MGIERTFVMLKPGILQRRIVGEILTRLEKKGLKIAALKMIRIPVELCRRHYSEHRDKEFFSELVDYMTSGPVVAMVLEGNSAISVTRGLCGPTAVEDAQAGTIRGDYCARTRKNIIHASDSPESAAREIGMFFSSEEIIDWEDGNAGWFV